MADRGRLTEVKVGAFVLAALAVLVAGTLWIAGGALVARKASYTVLLQDSGGVKPGDRVLVAGISVGRIRAVELRPADEWPVAIRVSLRGDVPIHEDGRAAIATSGLIGSNVLQIDTGSPAAPRVPPGGTIYGDSEGALASALSQVDAISVKVIDVLERTSSLIQQVSDELSPIMRNLDRLLSEENTGDVGHILAGLRSTVEETGPRLAELLGRMNAIAARLEAGTESMPELTEKIASLVEDLDAAIGPDGERLAAVLDGASGSLESADRVLSVLDQRRGEIDGAIVDLGAAAGSLRELARQLEERPFSLIRIKPAPDRRPGDDE